MKSLHLTIYFSQTNHDKFLLKFKLYLFNIIDRTNHSTYTNNSRWHRLKLF